MDEACISTQGVVRSALLQLVCITSAMLAMQMDRCRGEGPITPKRTLPCLVPCECPKGYLEHRTSSTPTPNVCKQLLVDCCLRLRAFFVFMILADKASDHDNSHKAVTHSLLYMWDQPCNLNPAYGRRSRGSLQTCFSNSRQSSRISPPCLILRTLITSPVQLHCPSPNTDESHVVKQTQNIDCTERILI